MAFCRETHSWKRLSAMLFFLTFLSACTAVDVYSSCPRQCREVGWNEAFGVSTELAGSGAYPVIIQTWIVCTDLNGTVSTSSLTLPCSPKVTDSAKLDTVAVKRYPIRLLSARLFTHPAKVATLALLECEITDIEENTMAGLGQLRTLALDFNGLSYITHSYFSALHFVNVLTLSNNEIEQMDPGSFISMKFLFFLNLRYNLLRVVKPDWFLGLNSLTVLYLKDNRIEVIPLRAFRHLPKLIDLHLGGNKLTSLGGDWSWHLAVSNRIRDQGYPFMFRRQDVSVRLPGGLLCITHDPLSDVKEQTLGWSFDSIEQPFRWIFQKIHKNTCIDIRDIENPLPKSITTQAPFVAIIKRSLSDMISNDTNDQCRKVWEHSSDLSVSLLGGLSLRLAFLRAENTETLTAIVLSPTTNTTTGSTATGRNHLNNITDTSVKNITCVVVTKDKVSQTVFSVHQLQQRQNDTDTDFHSGSIFHPNPAAKNESLVVASTSCPQASTMYTKAAQGKPVRPTRTLIIILTLPILGGLVVVIVVFLLKRRSMLNKQHIRAIRRRGAVSGRARSASLPTISRPSHAVLYRKASCRSLPVALHSIEPTYYEISDDAVLATRPLPVLPHTNWEIPDVEPTSCNTSEDEDDDGPLRFYAAAADMTLVGNGEGCSTYHGSKPKTVHYHRSAQRTAIYENPEVQRVTFHRNAENPYRHQVTRACGARRTSSVPIYEGRTMGRTYMNVGQAKGTSSVIHHRAARTTAGYEAPPASLWTENRDYQTVLNDVAPWTSPPNTYWPWEISNGQLNRSRPVPLVFPLPNTYWPWEETSCSGNRGPKRRASLPTYPETTQTEVSLNTTPCVPPNTYWPWEITGESSCIDITQRRASLPTLSNTYIYCETTQTEVSPEAHTTKHLLAHREISKNERVNSQLAAPNLPNTYWPWEVK
ncbi:PREDICTED: uncharacterized protein LOC109488135 [Branchiostoma belcheri]|uniref:Uncharacterized protein LOC109488135 n=1 Tax=Branchiostoma belcheri TaxID=7741 RepID=A0A6P5A3M6_BRABE|nr:PREDICTED: uncharacterized protein LOC109488135 [Branchiostoma belcheri]